MALIGNLAAIKSVMLGTIAVQQVWLGTVIVWENEIAVTISANTAHVNIQSLFTAGDWASIDHKRVIIDPGVTVWGYTNGTPALRTGTGRGGKLYIDVIATAAIRGHAGAANSGVGGTALLVEQSGVYLNNAGTIAGGGGGGGKGGQGGSGTYNSTATDAPAGSVNYHILYQGSGGDPSRFHWIWAGVEIGQNLANGTTIGAYTYYQGAAYAQNNYLIYRQYTVANPTTGGAGGAGGTGQGFNASLVSQLTSGSAGVAGGTNAGAGATGGAGGAWGTAGTNGPTGASGNVSSGSAGVAGGLAGYYLSGAANLAANTNTGSLLGRVA